MRPIPRIGQVGQRGRREHLDGRKRIGRPGSAAVNSPSCERDQDQPWPELVSVGRSGREEPGKIGGVELDPAQVIRLEVGGGIARLGADDVPRVDADNIARPVQLDIHCRGWVPATAPFAESVTCTRQAGAGAQLAAVVRSVQGRLRYRGASRPGNDNVRGACSCGHLVESSRFADCRRPRDWPRDGYQAPRAPGSRWRRGRRDIRAHGKIGRAGDHVALLRCRNRRCGRRGAVFRQAGVIHRRDIPGALLDQRRVDVRGHQVGARRPRVTHR